MLKDEYESTVLRPIYEKTETYTSEHHENEIAEHDVIEDEIDENNMVELLYVSDDFGCESGVTEIVESQKYDAEEDNSKDPQDENINISEEKQNELTSAGAKATKSYSFRQKSKQYKEIVKEENKGFDNMCSFVINGVAVETVETEETETYESVPLAGTETVHNEDDTKFIAASHANKESTVSTYRKTRSAAQANLQLQQTSTTDLPSKETSNLKLPTNKPSRSLVEKKEKNTPTKQTSSVSKKSVMQNKMAKKNRTTKESDSFKRKTTPTMPKSNHRKDRAKRSKLHDVPKHDIDEGESEDEFPARDSDNEDWPAQQTMNEFPKQILKDGLLLVKGKQLMTMICKYVLNR